MKFNLYPIILGLFIFLIPASSIASGIAGPDTTVCEGLGVMIGPSNSNPEFCYYWTPHPAMINQDFHNPRIMVKPTETTVFTLSITSTDFASQKTGTVKVTVKLGGIVCSPSYTEPNSYLNQIQCQVTNKDPALTYKWTKPMNNGGCNIDPNTGVISDCDETGTYKVRIEVNGDPSCFAEEEFEVNVGVKDVYAIDIADPQRFAKSGETLYLVDRNDAELKAIPNPGFSFSISEPDWSGDETPPAPHVNSWNSNSSGDISITAGEKTVQINRSQSTTASLSFGNGLKLLLDYIKNNIKEEPNAVCVPPISFEFNPNLNYTETEVNKFRSPLIGIKSSISGGISFSATGKSCLPPPYSGGFPGVITYSGSLFITGSAALNLNGARDESVSANPEWNFTNVSFSGALAVGLSVDLDLAPPGDVFSLTANITGKSVISLSSAYNFSNKRLTGSARLDPLVISGSVSGWYLNPNNKFVDLSGSYLVMDPFETDTYTLKQF